MILRLHALVVLGAVCALLVLAPAGQGGVATGPGSAPPGDDASPSRPNIVFIVTDDQRADTLSVMPAVERELVRHGVLFRNAFVSNSLCCPSRASILTGKYSHSTSVYLNAPPFGGWEAFVNGDAEEDTIATRLSHVGYRTALVGKYLNGYGVRAVPGRSPTYVPPGWSHWVAFSSLGYYRYTLNVDGTLIEHSPEEDEYSTDVLAGYAESFIRTTREPFFLYFAPYAPHGTPIPAARHADAFSTLPPWRPAAYDERDVSDKPGHIRYRGRFGVRQTALNDRYRLDQLRTLLAVDDAVESLVGALADTGRLGNTMIVFTSDNGVAWGEHRLAAGLKGVPYDEATRVPLVVRYDPWTQTPREEGRLVLNVDFAPTFAALARAGRWSVDGRSFLPLLGPAGPLTWREDFLLEHLRGPPQAGIPTYCGLRGRRFLYVAYRTGEEELYDLRRDPDLLDSVAYAKPYQRTVTSLRRRLRTRLCVPPPPGFSWPEVLRRQEQHRAAGRLPAS